MALGRRETERQADFWIATQELAETPTHVFYERLNRILAEGDFDAWIEQRCEEYYADQGRPSIPPGVYFRMLFIGYFEDLSSQRGIAWRCADSLSLRKFLGFPLDEATPDHSSLTRIRDRLPYEVYLEVFRFVLTRADQHKLVEATTAGVDSTTLEANAAMKAIVRKDSGEDWEAYVKRLAALEGFELKTKAELIRYDKERHRKSKKKVSNTEWQSPADPDARIAKMKDGTTHLAYKAEHVVDLKTEVILTAEVYAADQADSATLVESVTRAQAHLDAVGWIADIAKVAADKGYHKAAALAQCAEANPLGIKTYIAEPQARRRRRWTNKPLEQQEAVVGNRQRTRRAYGKRLQRRRSEVVERSFAHVCETGGARRSWLRGLTNVRKRYALAATAYNLGRILRKLLGAGKPKEWAARPALLPWLLYAAIAINPWCRRNLWPTPDRNTTPCQAA